MSGEQDDGNLNLAVGEATLQRQAARPGQSTSSTRHESTSGQSGARTEPAALNIRKRSRNTERSKLLIAVRAPASSPTTNPIGSLVLHS